MVVIDSRDLRQEYLQKVREQNPLDQPPSRNLLFTECPEFGQRMTMYGTVLGFTVGGMAFAHDGRKHYRTLLEDLAEPQKKITVPKTTSLYVLAQRTMIILSKAGKGAAHGALYGYSNCAFRNMGLSDRMSLFLSGGVFAFAGRSLWAGGNAWYSYGLIFACASALFRFNNDFLMIDGAGVTKEQAIRARKRLEEKTEFIQERINEHAFYKDVYLAKHPEKNPKDYEFYTLS